ncbi:type II toxin-antitoxin system death-on-curing family toxin [Limnospira fusiformis CCALA 023]
MSGWVWVPVKALMIFHDRQISRHGGAIGLRDLGLLEMGCNRAANAAAYGTPDVFEMAAAYAYGICKAHAFVDGNKRTAFVAAFTFLRLNGHPVRPDPREGVRMMEGLASDEVSEAEFADWLREVAQPSTGCED